MKNIFIAVSAATTLAVSVPVLADPYSEGTGYFGAGLSQLTFKPDGSSDDVSPSAVIGRLGYFVADQVAVEARVGFGLSDDSIGDVDVELDRLFGVYGVGHLPIDEKWSIYGLIGYTDAEATASAGGFSATDSDSGFTLGLGAEFFITPEFGLNLEYTRYLDESGYELSSLALGGKYNF